MRVRDMRVRNMRVRNMRVRNMRVRNMRDTLSSYLLLGATRGPQEFEPPPPLSMFLVDELLLF
ncbi:hypothetical protein EYF80_033913 [Liparis tanakae]|uniref:Uncharacterized protein n=1 Tax=Liparis tanakae TaxID=230148 RepID=A0A4Z2GRU1_9TELE|nr:hypothetical protein EYF80_033913 [Liparis tanakae]